MSAIPAFVPAGSARHDPRPSDLTPMDDKRIRLVASRVASSSHSARYQMELVDQTRAAHHFLFLDSNHPWHSYYQYCLSVFNRYTPDQWQQLKRSEEAEERLELQRRAAHAASTGLLVGQASS